MAIGKRAVGLALVVGLTGCVGPSVPQNAQAPQGKASAPARALHTAFYEPPAIGGTKFVPAAALADYALVFGASLVRADSTDNLIPRLAAEVPSRQAGTWRVLEDSRMETTHRLRPALTWHDGAPFTVEDVIFTWQAIMNPALVVTNRNPEHLIESIEPIDTSSFRIRWKEVFIHADGYSLEPIPKHILGPLLQQDPQSFVNNPYWTTEWVGLGPYRLAEFMPGSHVKGIAFPQYALGAPRIEEIYVHFVAGAQQAVTGMLAGTLDVPLGVVIQPEEGAILRQELVSRGDASILTSPYAVRVGSIQLRDPLAPAARDARVRRALVHAVDRPLMVEALHFGMTVPADTFVFPSNAAFSRLDRTITKLPYDPNRAAQLLAQADWVRGADGFLRDREGQPFSLEVQTTDTGVKEAQVAMDAWATLGIGSKMNVIPRALQDDREYRAKFTGIETHSYAPGSLAMFDNWRTDQIPTEATRWRGGNRGGYTNPATHQLAVDYNLTLDAAKREDLLVELYRVVSEEVPTIPFYYTVRIYVIRAGLKGISNADLGEGGGPLASVHQLYWE